MPVLIHPTSAYCAKKQKAICLWRRSCDTFLSVRSTTLLGKEKKSNPFGSSAVPLLVFATQRYKQKPLQAQDFTQALQCLATDTGGLVKNTLASLAARSVRTASHSSHYIEKDMSGKSRLMSRENTLTSRREIHSVQSKWAPVSQSGEEEEEDTHTTQQHDGKSCISAGQYDYDPIFLGYIVVNYITD